MSCPCDQTGAAFPVTSRPGLSRLAGPALDFLGCRRAMLHSIREFPAFKDWKARQGGDPGVMLIEFFAYVGHTVSLYNWAFSNESYLRTAFRPETASALGALIGYLPRPAMPARALLVGTASSAVTLEPGIRFRSGAFAGEAPQVFEVEKTAALHPEANAWTVVTPRRATLGAGAGTWSGDTLDFELEGFNIEVGDIVALELPAHSLGATTIGGIEDAAMADGRPVKRVTFSRAFSLPEQTLVDEIAVLKPGSEGGLFTLPSDPNALQFFILMPDPLPEYRTFDLDRVRSDLRAGQSVIVSFDGDHRAFRLAESRAILREISPARTLTSQTTVGSSTVTNTTTVPAVTVAVTRLTLDTDYNDPARRPPGAGAIAVVQHFERYIVRGGMVRAGRLAAEPVMAIWPGEALALQPGPDRRHLMPPGPTTIRRFILADTHGQAYAVEGSLDPAGRFLFEGRPDWTAPLMPPLRLYGNIIEARRGETRRAEVLGSGDAAQAGQSFALSKAPLAFLMDETGTASRGYRSSVTLRVNGVAWREVESFATSGPEDEVFAVRNDARGRPVVLTGDGRYGKRASTGAANVAADYIFGAGAAAPPAGSLNQIATPVAGLASVTNPMPGFGGADAEDIAQIRTNAPASALTLGRIVSLEDAEAMARSFPGVEAARAEWRWHPDVQTACIEILCVAPTEVAQALTARLRAMAEPGVRIVSTPAQKAPLALSMIVEIDERYIAADLRKAIRQRLTDPEDGLLTLAGLGIEGVLFRSRVFAEVLSVPGAKAVTALSHDGVPFVETGLRPPLNSYFSVAPSALVINGEAGVDG
jgi:hypothetical protein